MFEGLNALPIIAAIIADQAIRALWYSQFLFGNYWMNERGITMVDIKTPGKAMALGVVSSAIMAVVLAIVLLELNVTTVDGAIETAFLLWLGFVATTNFMRVAFEEVKPTVYFLQIAYHLIGMIVMAIILVSWK
jgi:hypothetical protein